MRFVFMVYSIAGWVALALLLAYWMVERVIKRAPVEPLQAPPPSQPAPRGFEVVPSPPPAPEGSETQKTTDQP